MAVSLGQNLFSRQAQAALSRSTSALSKSFERLSSGQRINRASDDAAGLAVSESLKAKSRIFGRARLNINDGISALEVAQSTLGSAQSMLMRMAELAEQSANGSLSNAQRKLLDAEYQQLTREIVRTQKTTQFNGVNLLDGSDRTSAAPSIKAALGGTGFSAISGDGRYLTYVASNSVEQLDLLTGQSRRIANSSLISELVTSAGGETVVYIDSSGKNAFVWSRATGQVRQVVDGTGALSSNNFELSADGSTLAFFSTGHYDVSGHVVSDSGSTYQLHAVNLATNTFQSLQYDFASSSDVMLSADGSYLAFSSSDNVTGENPAFDLRGFVARTSSMTATVDQIGSGYATWDLAGVTSDGKVFFSSPDNITGENPSGVQLFSYTANQPSSFRQVTSGAGYGFSTRMKLNSDGETISFISSAVIGNQNPDGVPQVFRLELGSGQVRQLTSYTTANPLVGGNVDAFSSDGFSGTYGDGVDLYVCDFRLQNYQFNIETGSGAAGSIHSAFGALDAAIRGLGSMMLTSQSSAGAALEQAQTALQSLAQLTGVLGAAMSRLDVANTLVSGNIVVTDAARSRIVDADIAEESASLVLSQIRQQTGASLLAQANLQPQLALTLLRA